MGMMGRGGQKKGGGEVVGGKKKGERKGLKERRANSSTHPNCNDSTHGRPQTIPDETPTIPAALAGMQLGWMSCHLDFQTCTPPSPKPP